MDSELVSEDSSSLDLSLLDATRLSSAISELLSLSSELPLFLLLIVASYPTITPAVDDRCSSAIIGAQSCVQGEFCNFDKENPR